MTQYVRRGSYLQDIDAERRDAINTMTLGNKGTTTKRHVRYTYVRQWDAGSRPGIDRNILKIMYSGVDT